MKKNLHFAYTAPLHKLDTEIQTYGCRANNPDICSSNSLNGVCAFVASDNICRKPSKAWSNKYRQLRMEKSADDSE